MASGALFEENFKQNRLNHALTLNQSGAKLHIPRCLRAGDGVTLRGLVSNLTKGFSAAQSVAVMLPMLSNDSNQAEH
jgi:hypothetical protein